MPNAGIRRLLLLSECKRGSRDDNKTRAVDSGRAGWFFRRAMVVATAAAEFRNALGSNNRERSARLGTTIDDDLRCHRKGRRRRRWRQQAGCQPWPYQAGIKHRAGILQGQGPGLVGLDRAASVDPAAPVIALLHTRREE